MSWPILSLDIGHEPDIVTARQKARKVADLLGFDTQNQTRIATAVSEIARNAFAYADGGSVDFALAEGSPQQLVITVRDNGQGIPNLEEILAGRYRSRQGMGVGLTGSRRLMDGFTVETGPEGTTITLAKNLSGARSFTRASVVLLAGQLRDDDTPPPLVEVQQDHAELLRTLTEMRDRQGETDRLYGELEATNRGVLALHASLDQKAIDLEALNATLAERVDTAVAARHDAEEGLRQAQKMEAVGQLTGGIAHDFNNLLQIIVGNLDMLDRLLPAEATRLRRVAGNAMEGARRAATLTQRLLAFSRRQPLAPRVFEVNALMDGMVDLLRHTIGEAIAIELQLADATWTVEADPNQLENALLNLVVNARDAMEGSGRVTIATRNETVDADSPTPGELAPGDYVAISVTDNGSGMSAATILRVFEPFFTTKSVGKGTGLGLSMVYGFAKQSGGCVSIVSQPAAGTSITIFLPRADSAAADAVIAPDVSSAPTGTETILVVEDDEGVREHTAAALAELGYTVLSAHDGDTALAIIAERPDIQMLFTDVILAGRLSGAEVADAAARALPGVRILYTTGYARDVIVADGRLKAGVQLLPKPFTFNELAGRIRAVLDQ